CGCLVNSHCDDSDPCTSDTCSPPGSCNNDPIPDDDGDGLCNAVDNCPEFWNPTQDAALFGQTIEVSICDSVFCLVWPTAVPMLAVRGDFIRVGDIGTYLTNAQTPPSVATAVLDGTVPAVGAGLWYLVQPDCAAPSWSSGGPGELTGARDASPNLP
ncbi:MAG: hypothetical protein O7A07_09865, partial [Acidobacteria bacterium]|nr:hypothetical protein [Acidobacteriota bacterium]